MLSFKLPLTEEIQKLGIVKHFENGSVILDENSTIRNIPIVLKGSMKVFRTDEDGREILLYYIKAGETCIMSFMGGMHQDTSKVRVVTEEETEILFIPIDKLSLLIKENPEWLDFILELYHKRFEELLEVVNAIAFQKLDERIMVLLQKKIDLHHSKEINITHQQLAEELGASREVVSRFAKTNGKPKLSQTFSK